MSQNHHATIFQADRSDSQVQGQYSMSPSSPSRARAHLSTCTLTHTRATMKLSAHRRSERHACPGSHRCCWRARHRQRAPSAPRSRLSLTKTDAERALPHRRRRRLRAAGGRRMAASAAELLAEDARMTAGADSRPVGRGGGLKQPPGRRSVAETSVMRLPRRDAKPDLQRQPPGWWQRPGHHSLKWAAKK